MQCLDAALPLCTGSRCQPLVPPPDTTPECKPSNHCLPRCWQAFLEGLLEGYCTELGGRQHSERAMMLSAAAVELLRGHPLLADHAVGLGYVERLLKLLAARLPSTPQGKPPAQSKTEVPGHSDGLS